MATALFVLLSLVIAVHGSKCPATEAPSKHIVCYYEGTASLDTVNLCNCTHLIFANGVRYEGYNLTIDKDLNLNQRTALDAKNLSLIFTLSIGKTHTDLLKSEDKRIDLLNGVSSFLRTSSFNGVEVDFEFSVDDGIRKEQFLSFVKDLRDILDHHRVKRDGYSVFEDLKNDYTTGRYSTEKTEKPKKTKKARLPRDDKNVDFYDDDELSAVEEYLEDEPLLKRTKRRQDEKDAEGFSILLRVPTVPEIIAKKYDLKALAKYVDFFMLPTHMITDDSEKHVTFHPSRLMGLSDILNTDSILDLLTGLGAPKSKIIISMPANVLQHELKDAEKNTARSPTVGQTKIINQLKMCNLLKNGDWTVERDEDLTAPYAFSKTTWLAFEDEVSVNIKAKYILLRELAGGAVYPIDSDIYSENCAAKHGGRISSALQFNFANLARKPRQVVLESLQEQIHDTAFFSQEAGVHLSEYRIVRVVDHEGAVHVIRKNTKTEFECSRQGYFSHPLGCNKFYRCVKFDQYSDDFTVFEYDCPAGLAFDERWEVCVWPGSLPHGAPCTGSSEIAPVPRSHYGCPNVEGYYADPENCRWFFACLDHARDGVTPLTAYEFRCPFGLVFDERTLVCDWPWVVGGCGARGSAGVVITRTGGASAYEGAASFATIPDYVVSGGRIADKHAGVVLNQNIAGLTGPAGISAFISSVTPSSLLVEDGGSSHRSNGGQAVHVNPTGGFLVDDGGSSHRSNGGQAVHVNPTGGFLVDDGGSSHRGSGLQAVHVTTPSSLLVEDGGFGHLSHGLQGVHVTPAAGLVVDDGGSQHRSNGFQAVNLNPSGLLVEDGGSRHRSDGLSAIHVTPQLYGVTTPSSVLVENGGYGLRSHGLQAVNVNPAAVVVENGGASHGSNVVQTVQVSTPVTQGEVVHAVHVTTPRPITYQQETLVKPGVRYGEGYSYEKPAIAFELPSKNAYLPPVVDKPAVYAQHVVPVATLKPLPKPIVYNQPAVSLKPVFYQKEIVTPRPIVVQQQVYTASPRPVIYQQEIVTPRPVIYHQEVSPVVTTKPVVYQQEIVQPVVTPKPVVYQQQYVTPKPVVYQQHVVQPVVSPKPVVYQQEILQPVVTPKPVVYQQQYVTPKPVIYQQQVLQPVVTPKPVVYQQQYVTPKPVVYQQQYVTPKPVVYQQEVVTPKPVVYQQQFVTPKPVVYQQEIVQPVVTPKPVVYQQQYVTPKPVVYQQEVVQPVVTPKPVVYQQQYVTPTPVVYQQEVVTPRPTVLLQQRPILYSKRPPTTPKVALYQQVFNLQTPPPVTVRPVVSYRQEIVTPRPVIYQQQYVTPKPVVYQQEVVTPKPVVYQQQYATPKPVVYQQQYVTPKPVVYQQEIVTPKPVVYQQEVVTPRPVVYQQQYVTNKPVVYQQEIVTPKPVVYQQEIITPKPVVYQQQYVTPKPVVYQQEIVTPKPVVYQQEIVTPKPVVYQQQYVTPKPVVYQQEVITPKPVVYQQQYVTPKPVVYQQEIVTPKLYKQKLYTPKQVIYQQEITQEVVTPKPVVYQQEIVTPKPVVYQQEYVTPKAVLYTQRLPTKKLQPVSYAQPIFETYQTTTPKTIIYQQNYEIPLQQDIVKIKRVKVVPTTPRPTFLQTVTKQTFQPIVVPQILTTPKTVYAETYERVTPSIGIVQKEVQYSGEEYLPPQIELTTAQAPKITNRYEIPPPPPEYIFEVPTTTVEPTKYTVRQRFRTTTESREYLPPVEPKRRGKSRGKTTIVSIGQVDKAEVDDQNLEGVLDKYSGKYGELSEDDKEKFVTKVIQGNQRGTIKIGKEPEVSTVGYEITSSRSRSRGGSRKYGATSTSTTEAYEETSAVSDVSDTGDISLATLDLKNLKIKKNKKTVIVVSQVSDANPILIGKLAGQCSCQSNKVDLKKNDGEDDGAYDGNYDVEPSTTASPRSRTGKSRGRRPNDNESGDEPTEDTYAYKASYGRRGGPKNQQPEDNAPNGGRRGGSRNQQPDEDAPNGGRRGGSRNRPYYGKDEDAPSRRGGSRNRQPEGGENGGYGLPDDDSLVEIGGQPSRGERVYDSGSHQPGTYDEDTPRQFNVEILNNPTSTTTLIPEVSPSILLPLARKPITDSPNLPERATGRRIPSRSKARVPFTEKTSPLFSPITADEIVSTVSSNDVAEPSKTRAGAAFDRYGPGGWRGADETLQGSVDCKRPGLFRHPKYCNKFYSCNYDPWKKRYTLSVFNCPVHLAYDSNIGACNWPSKGPACADDNLLV